MSRSRNIKPGFFKNDVLVTLPFEYRLMFIGLWTLADRDGRLEDRPLRIKMELFAADSVDVDAGLWALHTAGFVTRYVVDSIPYICINAWSKHQNPHVKEVASCIPAPCESGASTVQAPEIPERAGLIPDSLNLIPDSSVKATVQQAAQPASRFEEFWKQYPVKKGRTDAEKKWRRMKLDPLADTLIAHVRHMLANDDGWQRGFIPHGSTYINGQLWTDEPKGPTTDAKREPSKQMQALNNLQEMRNGLAGGRGNGGFPAFGLLGDGSAASGRGNPGNGNGLV